MLLRCLGTLLMSLLIFQPISFGAEIFSKGISKGTADGMFLKLDGSNANSNIDIGVYDFATTGKGTFGSVKTNQLNSNEAIPRSLNKL